MLRTSLRTRPFRRRTFASDGFLSSNAQDFIEEMERPIAPVSQWRDS